MPYFLTRRKWHTICTNSIHLSVSKLKNTFSRPVRVVWLKSTHVLRTFKATTSLQLPRSVFAVNLCCFIGQLIHHNLRERNRLVPDLMTVTREGQNDRWFQTRCDCWEIPRWDERQSWSWRRFHNACTRHSLKAQRDHWITDKRISPSHSRANIKLFSKDLVEKKNQKIPWKIMKNL